MSKQAFKFDTLAAVCAAVKNGEKVFWKNAGYTVGVDLLGQWYVAWMEHGKNPHYVGLFWTDGIGTDYTPSEFYVNG